MKKVSSFTSLCFFLLLFIQCKKDKEPIVLPESDPPPYDQICKKSVTTTFEFEDIVPDGTNYDKKLKISLTLPDCFKLTNHVGIDDQYGTFIVPEIGVSIDFGMGEPAGVYHLDISPTRTEEMVNGRVFWYEEKDGKVYFAFPSAGPASFVTTDVENKENFLEYLRSLKVRVQ